ncbi:non-hydrolyzing UDP-N-acetylglucosamine 2-epimerase [Burkholderia multivorans]|uniref:UDP-N-acetylglucosamine 2-epimerase (non-hydrolyzing) n=1 Tax=Burkholderia multivorans TaxID=87883 RepID=A0AAP2HES7_9BURK|nr:UDP-N-acetylglucosamine 2-epimerase (non-hydrolyzing) [Burkholderia multivorans]MBU9355013.1 UDP-N-acetylglucosamine 2-epimerase (non-hydrolyzing) [Burkholderia multivorans]
MKIMVVMGTRPEVIKLAPVVAALRGNAEVVVCTSGQHREMLAQALAYFGIEPDVGVDTMSPGQSLNVLSARILSEMDGVLARERPDWVLVQGDTTTALCAGLAAFHRGIAVGHVEAGLRTGDLSSPFPEEANRSLLGRIATRHFAPTESARRNLVREGIDDASIVVTGNTVVDAIALAKREWLDAPASLRLPEAFDTTRPFVLVTCHRRENFGETLLGICEVLRRLCERYAQYQWIFPVHFNPSVREPVLQKLTGVRNLALIEPVDYPSSLYLISRSTLVISDSGGIQEEAPSFGVPVVVMRNHTERGEGIEAGFATLAGQAADRIEAAASSWLDDAGRRAALRSRPNPYGDGQASSRIVASLLGRPQEVFCG